MSEEQVAQEENAEVSSASNEVKLQSLFAYKVGMGSVYGENGEAIPVTVLRMNPWYVSQVKTEEKDGYTAVQVASEPKKSKNSKKAEVGHCKATPFENAPRLLKEVRQELPEGIAVGQKVAFDSLVAGDQVRISSLSKGRGYSGVIKRWGHGGGPASHGSKFHRRPGSIGNRTWPGRVMPGRKLPGQYGNKTVTIKNVQIVETIADENVIMVKGSVPGSKNTLVELMKV